MLQDSAPGLLLPSYYKWNKERGYPCPSIIRPRGSMPGTIPVVSENQAPLAYSYLGRDNPTNGGSGAVGTLTGASLGAAASDRYIIAAVCAGDNSAAVTDISAVTIGGVSASLYGKSNNAAPNSMYNCWAIALVPTGTTGNFVVTSVGPANTDYFTVIWWRVTGLLSAVPHATALDETHTSNAMSASIATVADGVLFCNTTQATAGRTVTWTNATERTDGNYAVGSGSAADADTTGSTPTITAQYNNTPTNPKMILSSWR